FWTHLQTARGITHDTWKQHPTDVGVGLIELVEDWHRAESREKLVDLTRSSYLVLSWQEPKTGRGAKEGQNTPAKYQLHRFPVVLPDPATLQWSFPSKRSGQHDIEAGRLLARDQSGTVVEWYGDSGGQLKYYPSVTEATWHSDEFQLEPISSTNIGLLNKVRLLFPQQWRQADTDEPQPA
ncbi:MAG: hypothetical protein M3Z04_22730, partial [Chloroflexota bacterium]|nr:hypothetical protein [Chloroflexota bacterium]